MQQIIFKGSEQAEKKSRKQLVKSDLLATAITCECTCAAWTHTVHHCGLYVPPCTTTSTTTLCPRKNALPQV